MFKPEGKTAILQDSTTIRQIWYEEKKEVFSVAYRRNLSFYSYMDVPKSVADAIFDNPESASKFVGLYIKSGNYPYKQLGYYDPETNTVERVELKG